MPCVAPARSELREPTVKPSASAGAAVTAASPADSSAAPTARTLRPSMSDPLHAYALATMEAGRGEVNDRAVEIPGHRQLSRRVRVALCGALPVVADRRP